MPSTREVSEWLTPELRVIALVRTPGSAGWAAMEAVEVADLVGRVRPHTILVNTVPGSTGLDGVLGAVERPGIGAALSGMAPLSVVALSPPGRSFVYLPAGEPALSLHRLHGTEGFAKLVDRARQGGGTLLLYVAEEELAKPEAHVGTPEDLPLDAYVALGAPGPLAIDQARVPLVALIEGASEARGTSRQRTRRARVRRLGSRALGRWGLVLATFVAGVWLALSILSGGARSGGGLEDGEAGSTSVDAGRSTEPGAAQAEEPTGRPEGQAAAGEARPEAFAGMEVPYSVLVASYLDWSRAHAARLSMERDPGGLFLLAPTPVRGRVYYRLFAGALANRDEADARMAELVAGGVKEERREWDVRPVRLAFNVATFGLLEMAVAERDRLHEHGLPGYVLAGGDETAPAYRVYAGAFESAAAAAVLDSLLTAAGYETRLEVRRGHPR